MSSQERGTSKRKTFVSQTGSNGCAQDEQAYLPCLHTYTYRCIYTHMPMHIHTHRYICMSAHMCMCMHVYVYICVCACIYIMYMYMGIYIYGVCVFWGFLQARVTLRHCAPQARGLAQCQCGTTLGRPRTVSQSPGLTLLPFSPIKVFPVACRFVKSIV